MSGDLRGGAGTMGGAGAARAAAHLAELIPDVRGCAVLDSAGGVLAASGESERWRAAASRLLAAADDAWRARIGAWQGRRERGVLRTRATEDAARRRSEPPGATQVHVRIEEGEVFAVRHGGLAMVAVAERFTLASLVLFDMRTILRDLANGGVVDRRAPGAGPPEARAA